MSFRFHMKPVLAKPKPAVKPRADKAPPKGSAKSAPAEPKVTNPPAADDVPPESTTQPPAEQVENVTPAEQPPLGRTRTLSYRSQDESASSADESRKSKVVPRFAKARIKPNVPGVKKTPMKVMPVESAPQGGGKAIAPATPVSASTEVAEARVARQSMQTPTQVRVGPDFKPSPHLVPAAPNCVPPNEEISSSEDEGVIDPYNPDHPLGHRENPEKCRGTKSPWIMKKFRSGVPTAMIDYLFYNPKSNPMVHDDDKVVPSEKKEELEEDVDDPDEENEPQVAAPQLKLVDGKFVLDDTSLLVETTAAREGRKAMQLGATSGFNKRRSNRSTWTDEETLFFYKCLNNVGTDFAMMSRFFPNRTRHQIKLKFKLEEKRNPSLVDRALGTNAKYDVSELEKEYLDVSENAAKQRAQKRKPKEPKPKEKKTGGKRVRSRKARKDYLYEDGSASDEGSSSDDENDANLRKEMNSSMSEDQLSKKNQKNKGQQVQKSPSSVPTPARFAFLEVVPNTSAVAPKPLNPNSLSGSQVNQLMGQKTDKDQLRYGNSELAFLLNSPTIREKENEKKKASPLKSAAVRKIVLEETSSDGQPAQSGPESLPQETPPTNKESVEPGPTPTEEHRTVQNVIKALLNKRMEESGKGAVASEKADEPVEETTTRDETEDDDNSGDDDEMECIAQSFSKPTKSGRMPKLRNLRSSTEEAEPKPKKPRKAPVKIAKKRKSRSKSKETAAEVREKSTEPEEAEAEDPEIMLEKDFESEEFSVAPENIPNIIANVEPGSLVVIKTAVPNEPDREVVQVFMVPPANHSGTTVAHNPDGSVSQVTIGGTNVPLVPGTMITPATLVPIVAASSGSAVVHNLAEQAQRSLENN